MSCGHTDSIGTDRVIDYAREDFTKAGNATIYFSMFGVNEADAPYRGDSDTNGINKLHRTSRTDTECYKCNADLRLTRGTRAAGSTQ